MLTRARIRGYKSLEDVEVRLESLAVLFGPNAAGKSNFLDALQLVSKFGTSRTVKEAFDPPYRGKPIESFTVGSGGLKGLIGRDSLAFSIEIDLRLSDAVVDAVDRQIRDMRRPSGDAPPHPDSPFFRGKSGGARADMQAYPAAGVRPPPPLDRQGGGGEAPGPGPDTIAHVDALFAEASEGWKPG